MAEGGRTTNTDATVTETVTEESSTSPTLRLKLRKPQNDKKVQWTSETIDNEDMGKKKSKCCCIYEKPKIFGESSSEDEDDDDHCSKNCRGHKKKCYQHDPSHGPHGHDDSGAGPSGHGGASNGSGIAASS